jgi:protein TonB
MAVLQWLDLRVNPQKNAPTVLLAQLKPDLIPPQIQPNSTFTSVPKKTVAIKAMVPQKTEAITKTEPKHLYAVSPPNLANATQTRTESTAQIVFDNQVMASSAPTQRTSNDTTQLPSSDAQYLNNPKPNYPTISQRLGEQGNVLVRAWITKDGSAQKADIAQSSGFDRLDQAALRSVMSWRYTAGKRNGVAQDMWVDIPINFALQ